MHQIRCPWCGVRDEAEYVYRGDATCVRPSADADIESFFQYTYIRNNPKGWHLEWWHHVGGCRQWIKVVRNTLTHEIHASGFANEVLEFPQSEATSRDAK